MNLNPEAIKILCFGDSNTWGNIPGLVKRYPVNKRWTGLLQEVLGQRFCIIEEGLSARTTNLDDPKHFGKNGKTYLVPCLETHSPLDCLILSLGTNDLKERFHRSPEQIAAGIEDLVQTTYSVIQEEGRNKLKIILLSPPLIDESVEGVQENYLDAEAKSKMLGDLYRKIAEKYGLEFVDLSAIVTPSKTDGYHLEPEAHAKIANSLGKLILKLYP
jgi:lysophospholipase L1-like esterase